MKSPNRIASLLSALVFGSLSGLARGEVNQVEQVAPGVYFHEGDLKGRGPCNNGWVVFDDYVLVIDANFPSGAQEIIPKIKAITDKPIRFAFDTHHHGDHAYGNQVWAAQGATPVAHVGVVEEMKKYETGHYGNKPGRWEEAARGRPDVAASKLKPPTLLYRTDMIFDDGKRRVELLHFGVAHTHGDGFAWLPKERILFTGDACVNGPYNYMGDGNSDQWVRTLEAAKLLGAKIVCPGHGPKGDGKLLDDQQAFFIALRHEVRKHLRRDAKEMPAAVNEIRTVLTKNPKIARFVGDFLSAQVEKVRVEMGGQTFLPKKAAEDAHQQHAHAHGAPPPSKR
jgi:glyoxylase-like metal-dependent hydrolase (beta-lactamase superfamily II)